MRAKYTHAALMGDIVGSDAAPSAKILHRRFNAVMTEANRVSRRDLASPLTITLGDEFQGLCRTMSAGAMLMRNLRIRLMLTKVDCRFAIGLVGVRTPVNAKSAWNMMGLGLSDVRDKLEEKDRLNAYRFSAPPAATGARALDALGAAITAIERSWTERQLELASRAVLEPMSPSAMAESIGATQRVYYKIRTAAQLDLYKLLWDAVFESMGDLDRRYLTT